MEEFNSTVAKHLEQAVAGEWLLPSAALNRFEPPADMVFATVIEKETVRYGFRIGSLGLLIQSGSTSEILQKPAIWSLPGSPSWFLGLLNVRGNLVPVYELGQVLKLDARQVDEKKLVLVFDQGERAVGVIIDDFPKPLSALSSLPSLPILPAALNGHVSKGYIKDENMWLEFDHNSFFEEMLHRSEV
ncbi:MAG: chemotaxis protein CheW [Gallionellaceae bacterium]|jgi:twitching motility protein PilI